ncbi:GNAT family N-acetyltransferase [Bacillus clarus]|uniref:Acetyltransferase family protein n=1 Tax=Bacillus clarus TaxID=2338372 RepID=A0A090YNQ8_9BACI|nr:GNAT family N-acetyltransferase [Bacillus clarus]KFM99896.1 acetyltransferase family protein [Bacillus clarus]RFT64452.1 GNAT family N-acetyltransferase [Bacillus clarus]
MEIVKLNKSDIPDLLSLCESVGWLQHKAFMREQFNMYLSIGTLIGCIHENRLIATGGVFPFEHGFSSIGMLIVHPKFQRQGVGRMLLNNCLQLAHPSLPILLIATKAGVPLYQSYNFKTITSVHRFERHAMRTSTTPFSIKQIQQTDLNSLISVDQAATGAYRSKLYSLLLSRVTYSFKIERNHQIEAFALCIRKGDTLCITPLISRQKEDAVQLLQIICESWNGTIRIDVPHEQFAFRKFLQRENFQETLLSPLMIKNGSQLSGNHNMLFAMIDAALC